jgi:futalosine hydrolase
MKILIVAATPFEIEPLEKHLGNHFVRHSESTYQHGPLQVRILITGVGLTATAFSLGYTLASTPFDLAINAGICGALNPTLTIGQVVHVTAEHFADLGAEAADGTFLDAVSLGLLPPDRPPFVGGWLQNTAAADTDFLPKVSGISVNKVHGYAPSIERLRLHTQADVESMEGAAFLYACLSANIACLQIRAVSNYVEPRNKENWNIPLAVENLNAVLVEMITGLMA